MKIVVDQPSVTCFEAFNSVAKYWDWNLRQIDSGPFEASLFQLGRDEFNISYFTHNRILEHRGKASDNLWSFVFLSAESSPYCFQKQQLDQYGMLVLRPGQEIKGISHAGLGMYTICVAQEKLELKSELYDIPFFDARLTDSNVLNTLPTYVRNLASKINRLMERLSKTNAETLSDQEIWELEDELISHLLLSISPTQQQQSFSSTNSCQVLEKAIDFINERLKEKISIQDLCGALGVSERTLQYAFKENFGVSPINYMRAIRLNKVYQGLLQATDGATTISDLARTWGFNHMSQFTADYKKHFGELPSETLARNHD